MSGVEEAVDDGVIRIPYTPRKEFLHFHQRNQRFACMVAHRRAGKTVACINELVARAVYSKKKRPRYGYIGPQLKQAKKIAWEYLKEYTQGLTSKISESDLYVVLKHNGAEICVYGADNPDSFRGQYFDGVILDEYGDMSPSLWGRVILPTLADRRGWAVFIGTFKGKNHFYQIYRRSQGLDMQPGEDPEYFRRTWFNFLLDIDHSTCLSEEEKIIQRAEVDDEDWEQEFKCNPNAAIKGTYYAKIISALEAKGQINTIKALWDSDFPVDVYADLGKSDSTPFWFHQRRPDGHALVDYEEHHGKELDFYFDLLRQKPYRYGTIHLPHDAKAQTLAAKRTTIQQFLDVDSNEDTKFARFDASVQGTIIRILPRLGVQDGINASRKILHTCWFSPKCADGIEALRAYAREWDEDNKIFRDKPNHNWASNGADAFRYFATTAEGLGKVQTYAEEQASGRRIIVPQIKLDELFAFRERHLSLRRGRV